MPTKDFFISMLVKDIQPGTVRSTPTHLTAVGGAVYFIGTDPADGRTVAIFRGLPYELPLGIELYEHYYDSGVTLAGVPPARRASAGRMSSCITPRSRGKDSNH